MKRRLSVLEARVEGAPRPPAAERRLPVRRRPHASQAEPEPLGPKTSSAMQLLATLSSLTMPLHSLYIPDISTFLIKPTIRSGHPGASV